MKKINWEYCDSKMDMSTRLLSYECKIFDLITTNDINRWGILNLSFHKTKICIPIGFADIGLLPEYFIKDEMLFIGIAEVLYGINLRTEKVLFRYTLPTIFHAFVAENKSGIIIQDETGFIGISDKGDQLWMKLFSDIIGKYRVCDDKITGKTLEGESFSFKV